MRHALLVGLLVIIGLCVVPQWSHAQLPHAWIANDLVYSDGMTQIAVADLHFEAYLHKTNGVPVGEIVSMFYGRWHNTMLPGRVVARLWNPMRFVRHAFFKRDEPAFFLETYDPTKSARGREVLKAAKRY